MLHYDWPVWGQRVGTWQRVFRDPGDDSEFLPGACDFSFCVLAQYYCIFKTTLEDSCFKTDQLETKGQPELAFSNNLCMLA